jgi:hypothetical protein
MEELSNRSATFDSHESSMSGGICRQYRPRTAIVEGIEEVCFIKQNPVTMRKRKEC